MLRLEHTNYCTLRWGKVCTALLVSQWRWVGLDVVGLHERCELVRDLSQGLSSLMEGQKNEYI